MKKLELLTLAHPSQGPVLGAGAGGAGAAAQRYWVGADAALGDPMYVLWVRIDEDLKKEPYVDYSRWTAEKEALQSVLVPLTAWSEDPERTLVTILLLYQHVVIDLDPLITDEKRQSGKFTFHQELKILMSSQLDDLLREQGGEVWRRRALPNPQRSAVQADASSFILANCQYPAGLLDRTPPGTPLGDIRGPADRTWARLHAWRTTSTPEVTVDFGLLLGDQIYVDATAGLFDPALTDDRWARPHLMWLEREAFVLATTGLPLYTLPDDHEFSDNWEPRHPLARSANPMGACQPAQEADMALNEGRDAYRAYQHWDQRLATLPAGSPPPSPPPPLYRQGVASSRPFFLADTRTERKLRRIERGDDDVRKARIMSPAQFEEIRAWLDSKLFIGGPRFIASAANVLPRRMVIDDELPETAILSDAWDGYPSSLHDLLASIWASQVSDVVFLTGGEHLALFTSALISHPDPKVPARPVTVYFIQTPPVYAPFPFANADARDFRLHDDFQLSYATDAAHRQLRCKVTSEHIEMADGFVHLEVQTPATDPIGTYQINVKFHAASGQVVPRSIP